MKLIIALCLFYLVGGSVMAEETEHNWNYYGVEVEKWTQPYEGFVGAFQSYKYKDVTHYRICECGRVEFNEDGKWVLKRKPKD